MHDRNRQHKLRNKSTREELIAIKYLLIYLILLLPNLQSYYFLIFFFAVHNQEEVLMDSEMMSITSKVLKQCSRSLTKLVCSYNHVEFAEKIVCVTITTFYLLLLISFCNHFLHISLYLI